jgi:hypothetical protein
LKQEPAPALAGKLFPLKPSREPTQFVAGFSGIVEQIIVIELVRLIVARPEANLELDGPAIFPSHRWSDPQWTRVDFDASGARLQHNRVFSTLGFPSPVDVGVFLSHEDVRHLRRTPGKQLRWDLNLAHEAHRIAS